MQGKVCLVTGASTGIGKMTAAGMILTTCRDISLSGTNISRKIIIYKRLSC